MRRLAVLLLPLFLFLGCGRAEATETSAGLEVGRASWYGKPYHGRKTANGETYDMHGMTAAHPDLPFETIVKVFNLRNGKSVLVRINDRGPFAGHRVLDVSLSAALALGMVDDGVVEVIVSTQETIT